MKVRIIHNNIIPFKGYKAITFFPWIFCRKTLKDVDITHELIHVQQQKEMLIVPFFIFYGMEWLIRLIIYRNTTEAYRNISFEQEAYMHQYEAGYPLSRCHFAWIKYLTKKTYKRN